MKDVLNQILNVEDEAKAIVEQAREEAASIAQSVDADIKQMEEDLVLRRKRKIDELTAKKETGLMAV